MAKNSFCCNKPSKLFTWQNYGKNEISAKRIYLIFLAYRELVGLELVLQNRVEDGPKVTLEPSHLQHAKPGAGFNQFPNTEGLSCKEHFLRLLERAQIQTRLVQIPATSSKCNCSI
jgi:hypothetical protein